MTNIEFSAQPQGQFFDRLQRVRQASTVGFARRRHREAARFFLAQSDIPCRRTIRRLGILFRVLTADTDWIIIQ